jgi:hypothetical protein
MSTTTEHLFFLLRRLSMDTGPEQNPPLSELKLRRRILPHTQIPKSIHFLSLVLQHLVEDRRLVSRLAGQRKRISRR